MARVEADAGHAGFSQMVPSSTDISALILRRQVAPHALDAEGKLGVLMTFPYT